ncbi:subtilisin family serine protease [Microbacterium sp. SORGH_AS 421]|nr:subtilisin family serine protease [Microbacterium sp. SORGH_AS_0421]
MSLSAPGQAVASSWPLGGDCVVGADEPATSWATAYVSAAAALVASAHPTETPAQWAYRLEATAVRAQPDTRSNISGWGVVQPYDAIVMVPGTGLRGPKSPFVAASPSASPTATPEAVSVVIGPGPDAAAITTATGIGRGRTRRTRRDRCSRDLRQSPSRGGGSPPRRPHGPRALRARRAGIAQRRQEPTGREPHRHDP